ncbi:MAG TPA: M23 family metallopeptidase [Candidatus Ozemobacteraceae bacterium]|nr:M23 family metallopeptidase [Candidatus Ozemobacteraceae bacterium]
MSEPRRKRRCGQSFALWLLVLLCLPISITFGATEVDTTDDEEAVIFGGRPPRSTPSSPPPTTTSGSTRQTPMPVSSTATSVAGTPDLIYAADDLLLGDPAATPTLSTADAEQALKRLLGKNAWLAPLLDLEKKNQRDLLEKILLLENTVKGIDWKSLRGFRRSLQQQEMTQLWRLMQAFGIRKLSPGDFRNLQKIAGTIDTLKQLATRAGEREQLDRLSYALAQTQELLSRYAPSPEQARQFKQQALQNYRGILKNRSGTTTEKPGQSVETSDVQTRIFSLEQNFGGIQPLVAPSGKRVVLTSDLGMRVHPRTKKRKMHQGIDFAQVGCTGWPVQAIGPGRVVKSGWENGYGYVVIVLHDIDGERLYTRSAHLKQAGRAAVGTVVPKGGILGYCNSSGLVTGPHLHFEVRAQSEFGSVIDPKPIIAKGRTQP